MKTIRMVIGISLAVATFVYPAWAAQRTFVAGTGNDANVCSITAPCRSFGAAISHTDAGGEVIVLDSAGYGAATITQSVSIIAPQGIYAGISVFSGNGITINAGGSDKVILRGLSITGLGGCDGIRANAVGTLSVENCSISGFTSCSGTFGSAYGIVHSAPDSTLIIRDSVLQNNWIGVEIENSSGNVSAAIDHTRMDFNMSAGFRIWPSGGTAKATISHSTASSNSQSGYSPGGFTTMTYGAGIAKLNLESCVASNNQVEGILVNTPSSGSYTAISNCTLANNGTGVHVYTGSTAYTLGNNMIIGNTTNVSGTLTPLAQQ